MPTKDSSNFKGDILIVDDLPNNLYLLRDTLRDQGYKVRSATTGAMALRGAKAPSTELILLDIKLPDVDGYQVCQQLKADQQTADIPVIFLSALNDAFDKVKGFKVGGVDYISKPFQVEDVLARVETHLQIRRLQKSLTENNQRLAQEIAQRQSLEEALFAEKELAQVTLKSIGEAVITTDAKARIKYLNPMAEQLTGWKSYEAQGLLISKIFTLVKESTGELVDNLVTKVLSDGQMIKLEEYTILIGRDGTKYPITHSVAPILDYQSQIMGTVMIFRDVTEAQNLSQKLMWQANHDPLTGLANRRAFETKLTEAIKSAQQSQAEHVLCYIDLDQFKVVNDTGGHVAGDELLCQIANLLCQQVRVCDTIARLGGDEFGLLLYQCPLSKAIEIAEHLKNQIKEYRFLFQNKIYTIGASIGVVAIDHNSQFLSSVMSAADAACYAAKNQGRNSVHVYHPEDHELVQQRGERQWVVKINESLENNRFRLYCQKIVPIKSESNNYYYEVLLRLLDDHEEIVFPSVFIGAAERYGLMSSIDKWVITTLFSKYHDFLQKPDSQPKVFSINLSGASINNDHFLQFVIEQFKLYQIPPDYICFEITETAAISNFERARHFIHELKKLGCHFALDDFGKGMSSYAYLMNLPVDYLKIDGNFIQNINHSLVSQVIVESFNKIAHAMDLKTVAEFVENHEILKKLQELGIDFAQGYGISYPTPLQF